MNQFISKNNNYKTYKVLITILILLLFCGAGYMYNLSSRSKTAIVELKSDKLELIIPMVRIYKQTKSTVR